MTQDKVSLADRRTGSVVTEQEDSERFQVSIGKVLAGSLAAASAAAVASAFGVAGTVIGTALFSVVATVASALYEHVVRRTTDRLALASAPLLQRPGLSRLRPSPSLPWRRVATGAVLVFAVAFAGITAFEMFAGKPLSALWGQNSDTGTSLQRVVSPHESHPQPAPASSTSRPAEPVPTGSPTTVSTTPATSGTPTSTGTQASTGTSTTPPTASPTGTQASSPGTTPPPTTPAPTNPAPTNPAPTNPAPTGASSPPPIP